MAIRVTGAFMGLVPVPGSAWRISRLLLFCLLAAWCAFKHGEFDIKPTNCVNHTTGIPTANYSHIKYYNSK